MRKIKVYAICDGFIDIIENLNDGVFSEKMLGEGFFIRPTSNEIFSPLEAGTINLIFETKHALFLKPKDIDSSILIHIGIDTVKLNGKPFNYDMNLNDEISLNKRILTVNLEEIKINNLDTAIPVLINDESGIVNWKFTLTAKNKEVKKGDLIGEFIEIIEAQNEVDVKDYFMQSNKYNALGKELIKFVGTKVNYEESYNCMTRMRFKIKNKDLVDVEAINALKDVKGVIWKGNEIQIVIGQDVYKLKAEIDILESSGDFELNKKIKMPLRTKFLMMMGGIMVPLLPLIIGSGLLMAIVGILQQFDIMPQILLTVPTGGIPEGAVLLKDAPVGWAILYSTANTAIRFMGVAGAVSASRYFKFNMFIGAGLGIILSSPILYGDGGLYGFGYDWTLFKTGIDANPLTNPAFYGLAAIKVMPQGARIFVIIFAIFIAKKLEDWIIKWMPPQLDIMFRPFIIIAVVSVTVFFIIGPIWYVIEQLLGGTMYYANKLPLGLGLGLFAATWQIAVLFGMHLALGAIAMLEIMTSGISNLMPGSSISVWAQTGAVIAVAIVSRDSALRRTANSTILGGVLGITEPMIYGVNVPKVKPFFGGVLGAFLAGCFAGTLGVTYRVNSGIGFFEMFGYFSPPSNPSLPIPPDLLSNAQNGIYYILSCMVSLGLGIAITMVLYVERIAENIQVRRNNKTLVQLYVLKYNLTTQQAKELKEMLAVLNKIYLKEELKHIKLLEKQFLKYINIKIKLDNVYNKETKIKEKKLVLGKKLVEKNQLDAALKVMLEHKNPMFKEKIEFLQNEIKEFDLEIKNSNQWLNDIIALKIQEIDKTFKEIEGRFKFSNLSTYENEYKNSLNGLRIAYKINDPINIELSMKKELENLRIEQKNLRKQEKMMTS